MKCTTAELLQKVQISVNFERVNFSVDTVKILAVNTHATILY